LNTTIPLSKETKTLLFKLKSRLEQDEGRPINYDELMQILIRNREHSRPRVPLSEFQKLKGILSPQAEEVYEREHQLDLLEEERKGE
jgi:hypothetical protein